MSFFCLFSLFSPLPSKVPLLLAALGDGVAVHLALQIDINSVKRGDFSLFFIYENNFKIYFVISRIRPLPVRIFFSHPLPPLALGLVRAALDAELAGPPDDPGKKRSHNLPYKYFTNYYLRITWPSRRCPCATTSTSIRTRPARTRARSGAACISNEIY